jgi:type II restriction/modification system DNA methylase subunit YeeA
MNTKTFAQQSRRLLIDGVAKKLLYWGFDTKGNIIETPQKISGGYSFRGEVFDDPNVLILMESLKKAIQNKGIEVVVEEAAYTWFNRIMALRIMAKNGYEPALLINAEGLAHTPVLLQKARQGQYSFLNKAEQDRLKKIIGDYSKDQEAFSLLLVGYCHSNKMLNNVFGKIDDYTELLLPDNMLQDSGFLHLLNTTDAISDAEYQEVELIGWLYQFYISEKKDDVFASFKKGKKAEAKDIPAATQIFTPNWIVKYMVQNTAGKIWLDKHPNSPLKTSMKYLVENDNETVIANDTVIARNEAISLINNVEELTLIDPAAGSGHILVEGFDLLYQMYLEEYYTPEEAVESILKNNLFGLDIDDRAAQLATFAILLKAAKYYRDVFTKGWLPNVYAMPEEKNFSLQEVKDFLGTNGVDFIEELDAALRLMKQSKNLGSVMKLSLSAEAQKYIANRFNQLSNDKFLDINLESILQGLKSYIPVLLILNKKFCAVVANPPYMVSGKMNSSLKSYVGEKYISTKGDLCTVFMDVAFARICKDGYFGMINQTSWMFKPSFTQFRSEIVNNYLITSMLHLGPRVFDELTGEVVQSTSFIVNKKNDSLKRNGKYFDLVAPKSSEGKRSEFNKNRNCFFIFNLSNLSKIQDNILAYWLSEKGLKKITESVPLSSLGEPKKGIASGDDSVFFRYWFEINLSLIKFDFNNSENIMDFKWFPINKGGGIRKWSGNFETIVNWEKDGYVIKNLKTSSGKLKSRPQNLSYSFRQGITYNIISSKGFSGRMTDRPSMMSDVGPTIYNLSEDKYILGLLISKIGDYYFKALCPGYKYDTGAVGKFPVIEKDNKIIVQKVENNISISKNDWDSRETSWDFEKAPLLNESSSLKSAYQKWQENATHDFFQLHDNEEVLNRVFIDIYGLQEELTPEVALKDITILQEELNGKDLAKLESAFRENGANSITLPIKKAIVISQFISYAIGLFMGRYRLDKSGLNIAHPNPTAEELSNYSYNKGNVTIDDDAIIPLMGKNCNFADDALQQINQLLDTIWGHETRTENTNFIQECLDKDLEKFLIKDFYNYHCKMYKKKPIYWLFTSKTGAFQVLVYMHRMNAFTVEKIRENYMLEHLKNLRSEESMLQVNASNLNTQEAKRLDQVRKDLVECEAYDMELKNVADQQITFDLDDGVTANYALFESVLAKIN